MATTEGQILEGRLKHVSNLKMFSERDINSMFVP